jgi:hypothetical protein
MSKSQHKKAIEWEIERLNNLIDQKIVKGLDYKKEAKRHISLLKELNRCSSTWNFGKIFSSLTSF